MPLNTKMEIHDTPTSNLVEIKAILPMILQGLVYTISDYLSMSDRFPESGTKNAPEYERLHETWKAAQ